MFFVIDCYLNVLCFRRNVHYSHVFNNTIRFINDNLLQPAYQPLPTLSYPSAQPPVPMPLFNPVGHLITAFYRRFSWLMFYGVHSGNHRGFYLAYKI